MSYIRFISFISALGFFSVFCVGCGGGKPNPVASNITYGADDEFATRILDRSDRREVISIMKSSVVGPVDDSAHPARFGVRWNDVHAAAIAAGAKFELAVLSFEADSENDLKTIELISIREIPVKLLVRRVAPPEIYTASATVGMFDDNRKLADEFISAFNASMLAFGKKSGWPELKNE